MLFYDTKVSSLRRKINTILRFWRLYFALIKGDESEFTMNQITEILLELILEAFSIELSKHMEVLGK